MEVSTENSGSLSESGANLFSRLSVGSGGVKLNKAAFGNGNLIPQEDDYEPEASVNIKSEDINLLTNCLAVDSDKDFSDSRCVGLYAGIVGCLLGIFLLVCSLGAKIVQNKRKGSGSQNNLKSKYVDGIRQSDGTDGGASSSIILEMMENPISRTNAGNKNVSQSASMGDEKNWEKHYDEHYGCDYWWSPVTNETTWEDPQN